MTPCFIAAKGVEPVGAGRSALAEPSPSRTQRAFGGVSSAPIGPAEAFALRYAVTLSVNAQLCYRPRCLGGVIWEIPAKCAIAANLHRTIELLTQRWNVGAGFCLTESLGGQRESSPE
jgi:hypothetical protein